MKVLLQVSVTFHEVYGAGRPRGWWTRGTCLSDVRGIAFTSFQSEDVVRHPLVQAIVDAYERRSPKKK